MSDPAVRPFWLRHELPTWALIAVIYGGWAALTYWWAALPWYLLLPLGAWLTAWHLSLQHELLHGHPTRRRFINSLLGFPPLSLWLPYRIYRDSHLAHHNDSRLTDPLDDPESAYLTADSYRRLGRVGRAVLTVNNTFFGRILIGPLLNISRFLLAEGLLVLAGDRYRARVWAEHLLGCMAVLGWLGWVCQMPLWVYLLAFVYPGYGLVLIRSFAEHRAAELPAHRIAIVENSPLFGLLFLHNNIHIVHHDRPRMPWYLIPRTYRQDRAGWLDRNGGLLYDGYGDVMRRYALRPHHDPLHPSYASGSDDRSPAPAA